MDESLHFCCKVKGIQYFDIHTDIITNKQTILEDPIKKTIPWIYVQIPKRRYKYFLGQDLNFIVLLYKVRPTKLIAFWCSHAAMLCYYGYMTPVLQVLYDTSVTSVI